MFACKQSSRKVGPVIGLWQAEWGRVMCPCSRDPAGEIVIDNRRDIQCVPYISDAVSSSAIELLP
eukprot:1394875-Pyramimonas_sp.AAC.2